MTSSVEPLRTRALPWLAFVVCSVIWGSTWLAIKVGYDGAGAFALAGTRFVIAALILFGIVAVGRIALPRTRAEWALVTFVGITLFWLDYGLIYWGEQSLPSGVTAVLFAGMPLSVVILSALLGLEALKGHKVLGVLMGIGGVALLFHDQLRVGREQLLPALAVVTSTFCAAAASVASKKHGKNVHPAALNAFAMLIGSAGLFATSLALGEARLLPATRTGWLAVGYLSVFGSTITFLLYFWLLKTWSATNASFISVMTPVVALFLGAILLQEAPSAWALSGTALILAGVAVASYAWDAKRSGAGRLRTFLEFVKIEHSLFALPFVLAGLVLGLLQTGQPLAVTWGNARALGLVLAAAVGARTLAMTLNRIVDRAIDARNPRTASRALPAGAMNAHTAWGIALASLALLVAASAALNPLCLLLSPVLVALFWLYPYAKRVTWACHFVLGLAFFCAPVGGYLAVTGSLEGVMQVAPLAVGAALWVAGFDVIYAYLDYEFDRANRIFSVPARFGLATARWIAAGLHAGVVLFLGLLPFWRPVAWPYFAALGVIALLLAYEHAIADPKDAARINKAFFNVNAIIGWVLLAGLAFALSGA